MEYGEKKSHEQIIAEAAQKGRCGETIFNFSHLEIAPYTCYKDEEVIVDFTGGSPVWGQPEAALPAKAEPEEEPYY